MRPTDPPQEQWRVPETQAGAHLYAYGDPTWPRCGDLINRATTRAATSGDPLCRACLDWYAFEVDLPAHA